MNPRCYACGGEIIYGEEPFRAWRQGLEVYYCAVCIEVESQMLWPEDYGPRPPRFDAAFKDTRQ